MISALEAGREALRWVTGAAVPADGGATWPETRATGEQASDDLYAGTAGVLVALAEARLSGIADFGDHAQAAAGRLRSLIAAQAGGTASRNVPDATDLGLYSGLGGYAAALAAWASVSGDGEAADAARAAVRTIAVAVRRGQRVSAYRDLLLGEAGILLVLLSAGRRLVRLGSLPDGTLVVPHSIPQRDGAAPVSYGWCHGPTGTVRLFDLLDRLRPGEGWAGHAAAGRRAVRESGLPARLYPGFWDNLGQCCGTAGVGEMALDRYQETGDPQWLSWAGTLADDVLGRCIADEAGVRWSHTEYTVSPPELEPGVGWMQGAAGIAGWLLRLARLQRDGPSAARVWWPDRPDGYPTWPGEASKPRR